MLVIDMEQKYFQGSFDLQPYFEGWYFKVVTQDQKRMFAWIPSIAFTDEKTGYIQVLDSDVKTTDTVEFPISSVSFPDRSFIQLGDNSFKEDQICLNLKTIQHHYKGNLKLSSPTLLKTSTYAPTIMGPFSYFKYMQCNHGIISLSSHVSGTLVIDGKKLDMNGGTCYIEKDYGSSFPKGYLWLESHHAKKHQDCTIFCSYAHIPFPILSFYGLICVLRIKNEQEIFATWNGAKASFKCQNKQNEIHMKKRTKELTITWKQNKLHHLNAPKEGKMTDTVHESSMDTFQVILKKEGKTLFSDIFCCGNSEISHLL